MRLAFFIPATDSRSSTRLFQRGRHVRRPALVLSLSTENGLASVQSRSLISDLAIVRTSPKSVFPHPGFVPSGAHSGKSYEHRQGKIHRTRANSTRTNTLRIRSTRAPRTCTSPVTRTVETASRTRA